MPLTTRGIKLLFDWSFRSATRPTHFYLALVAATITPSASTKILSNLTEIASGNGYSSGGFRLDPNSIDFNALIEDDSNEHAYVGVKNIAWSAVGGNIPASGNPARHIILTTDEVIIGNRQVVLYESLGAPRTVADGGTLAITGIQARIQGGSLVRSIQRGTATLTGTSTSQAVTINAVDTSKTDVDLLGYNSNHFGDSTVTYLLPRIDLTNSTTITISRGVSNLLNGTLSVNYQVTEFY